MRVICAAAGLVSAPTLYALSFGNEQVLSSLGQPLRMTIPLLGATGDSLEAGCFRVVAPIRGEGLTVITQARVELQTSSVPPRLLIRSSRSVDEPVVRVTVEAGCDTPIRRDYTILLDPPPLQPQVPVPAMTIVAPPATERPSATPVSDVPERAAAAKGVRMQRVPASGARKNDSVKKTDATRDGASHMRATESPANGGRDQLQVQGGPASGSTVVGDASLAALAVPRLKVSSDLSTIETAAAPQPGPADELQAAIAKDRRARLLAAPIEEDLAPRLEADFVVAKRRLAELQAQLAAAGIAAQPGGTSAEPIKPGVAPPASSWDWSRWLWIPAALLVAGFIAFLFRQRRSQQAQPQFANAGAVTVVSSADDEFDTVMPTRTVTRAVSRSASGEPPMVDHQQFAGALAQATAAAAATAATVIQPSTQVRPSTDDSDRLNRPLFPPNDTAPHLDVTELSQVTDEAQVYADLGRNDQAIEILRSHIDSQIGERSSPAPWLMIFDLYRRTNNRAGYDELAPQFRKHFNGRMPDWDSYGHELALDDGLEAFPHLVARIERDWGTADARQFLEELLYDNRGGSRLGFSLAAYRDILLLLQIHEGLGLSPEGYSASTDWESRGADGTDGTPKWDLELDVLEPPQSGELDSFLKNLPPPDKS